MPLSNSVYIRFIWGVLALGAVSYILPHFFVGYTIPLYTDGPTLYDIVYYNSEGVFQWALAMTFSIMCLILDSNFKQMALAILKYLSYSISAILFVSMSFHFYYYNKSPTIELYIYGICVVLIMIRAWYTIGNLKHLISLCRHRLSH